MTLPEIEAVGLTDQQARELLYDWHGGMYSPEYAAASSGLVKSPELLYHSLVTLLLDPELDDERNELNQLINYLNEQDAVAPRKVIDGTEYLALPWHIDYSPKGES